MRRILFSILIILVVVTGIFAETVEQREFAELVIEIAYKAKEVTGLPASIVASQCIIETGYGQHTPKDYETGEESNNYFGIKSWGIYPYVESWTYEWVNGEYVAQLAKFRKYESMEESFIDYGRFIYENSRYSRAIVWRLDARRYILEIWIAGYATSPYYVKNVLAVAEQYLYIPKLKKE